ncbi:MAG TPA: hypothetical protein VLM79_13210, partial [Kofleriaceae bacterium]|nr:hypothetical protein [Kofleriaceae bacterium]
MSDQGLEKQVIPPPIEGNAELTTLKRKIDGLQILYGILFFSSLVILVVGFKGMPLYGHVAWAASLGGAVITRLVRQAMVRKYNRILTGGGPS